VSFALEKGIEQQHLKEREREYTWLEEEKIHGVFIGQTEVEIKIMVKTKLKRRGKLPNFKKGGDEKGS